MAEDRTTHLTEQQIVSIIKDAYWDIIKGPAFENHIVKIVEKVMRDPKTNRLGGA